jgi:hypothetical protein
VSEQNQGTSAADIRARLPQDVQVALAAWEQHAETLTRLEDQTTVLSVRLLAAYCLAIEPTATHMLLESSDQGGSYMCAPHTLHRDGVDLAAGDALEQANDDGDLDSIASYLPWSGSGWDQFVDQAHPYTNVRGGYFAVDLRLLKGQVPTPVDARVAEVMGHVDSELDMFVTAGAGQSGEEGTATDAAADVVERLHRVYGVMPTEERSDEGWTHPAHLRGITVITWDSDAGDGLHDGALVVQVDTDAAANDRRVRINLNDAPVWDGIAATDERPGRFFDV